MLSFRSGAALSGLSGRPFLDRGIARCCGCPLCVVSRTRIPKSESCLFEFLPASAARIRAMRRRGPVSGPVPQPAGGRDLPGMPGLPVGDPGVPGLPGDPGGGSGRWFAPLLGPDGPGAVLGAGSGAAPWAAAAGGSAAGSAVPGRARSRRSSPSSLPPPPPPPPPVPAGLAGGGPSSAGEAVGMVLAGLGWLARAETASVPVPVLAGWLRELERAQSMHAAARAAVLAAFAARRGYEADGQGSARTWLTWQTRVTRPAANAAVASARRLAEHPAVAGALARGEVSASWGRQICEWTDQFPAEARGDADVILLAAARGGADLDGLAGLAEEIRARTARPDRDGGDGFEDRSLRLGTTLGGAGRLHADLTPRAAAALRAVLDSLGARAGPEDTRSCGQRDHDALEEACRRLLAARCLPERAGQPVQLQLHLSLDDLLHGAGHHGGGQPSKAPGARPGFGGAAAGPGDDCDAAVAPIVTGRVDHDLLDALAARLARGGGPAWAETDPARTRPEHHDRAGCGGPHGHGRPGGGGGGLDRAAARRLILDHAVALLSGPSGLASWLRTGTLPPPAAAVSLPLDVGAVTDIIPPHLRRAIIARDRPCAARGCDQPPAACHVHHVIPRSRHGTTSLGNCILLCSFHHLILIHRWGWTITLNPDGTTTATSPDGRILHSHSPPATAA